MTSAQILGLLTGICFGFILQKAHILRYEKVIGALSFKDMSGFKFFMTAVLVGSAGVALLAGHDIIQLSHKPMNVGGVVFGGIIFGIALPFAGYCPGTAGGAVAEGRWHALFTVAGMLTGGAIFAEFFPFFETNILAWKNYGKISVPEAFGISTWAFILALWIVIVPILCLLEKKKL